MLLLISPMEYPLELKNARKLLNSYCSFWKVGQFGMQTSGTILSRDCNLIRTCREHFSVKYNSPMDSVAYRSNNVGYKVSEQHTSTVFVQNEVPIILHSLANASTVLIMQRIKILTWRCSASISRLRSLTWLLSYSRSYRQVTTNEILLGRGT